MITHALGFSRMGKQRELKRALESHWRGETDRDALEATARELRLRHWTLQRDAGLDLLPVGDFSLYDHILDMTVMLGAAPERHAAPGHATDPAAYFLMARGGDGVAPMEMSKWFDTNYHYLVPELRPGRRFTPDCGRLIDQVDEAVRLGAPVKAVLPGPLTWLYLGKSDEPGFDRFQLLPAVVEAYAAITERLGSVCPWIQFDEPVLALDLPDPLTGGAFRRAYGALAEASGSARLLVATYFGSIAHNLPELAGTPLDAVHIDLVRAPEQFTPVLEALPRETVLSVGVVDGRNVWRVDAAKALKLIQRASDAKGEDNVMVATSCSLLHVPVDLRDETGLPDDVHRWMAFGREKCIEVSMLADAARGADAADWLEDNRTSWESRRSAPALCRRNVRERMADVGPAMFDRPDPYPRRREIQARRLGLPLLPSTTIGSFPQTPGIRAARRDFKAGHMDAKAYENAMRGCIADAVKRQEDLGLDVLVHGEPERNDMVEYFGEQLEGFCFTKNGWVQSYGSRCVKPPVIHGDVSRPRPMTVAWSEYAQSLTNKPMKGMLTGPVTILCWSFVRDDQPRADTCMQIALAIRDEVHDLERAGLAVIQVDEPALREGAPLRRRDWDYYFRWAVDCFRLSANGAASETQMHTHMCYSEFNDIVEHIAAMDADVISIEASRSRMELLDAFRRFSYPNEIGPGVYDIHSPRVPSAEEMLELLERAAEVVPVERLWVNPDCGLKTRGWKETMAALENMVRAAHMARDRFKR